MSDKLSDEEICAIAADHVRCQYGLSHFPLPIWTLTVPDGIYFDVAPKDSFGDGGFFVSRAGGEICQFGSGHQSFRGIKYWLRRFAEGWRPGFYYLALKPQGKRVKLSKLLRRAGVAFRVRMVPGGSMWTWAPLVDGTEFLAKLQESTAVLLRAEVLDELRSELLGGLLKGCRFTHLGEFRLVPLPERTFLERVHSAEEADVATYGGFWVYLPTEMERRIANPDSETG
ncbi:hypothetical protein [Sorangium sp. So ce1153]|uniref:hypothetical protein n=1 Tax=Sorangium sp. So ce1153 TaxID=3133333 RepID=UPI003F5D7BC7